ncbi:MAG: hypothetical protein CMB31_02315 [Euryarchaeota archaeon]|nr:hypothetical protein [Euryarchaeota archaeon]
MDVFQSSFASLFDKKNIILEWLEQKRKNIPLPIYGSFDIRDAGWKTVVVDANAFPAGFNNLNPNDLEKLSMGLKRWFENLEHKPECLLLWPEAHTRNSGYLDNIHVIKSLIEGIGIEILVGTDLLNSQTVSTSFGDLSFVDVNVEDDFVNADGENIDTIFLNSDLSDGPLNISGVNVFPPSHMGWHSRSKCRHFEHVSDLVHELGDLVGIDPWLIGPWGFISRGRCLEDKFCRERLAGDIHEGLEFISGKYKQYNIDSKPSLFIKNDRGTYGLGIIRVEDPEEILNLSKRKMNRLTYAKGGKDAEDFLLQEAVPTFLTSNQSVIEPVGYGVNGEVVSWFFRSNEKHGILDNLNTPSTKFILDHDLSKEASLQVINRRWLHTLVANISMIAMGMENLDYVSSLED